MIELCKFFYFIIAFMTFSNRLQAQEIPFGRWQQSCLHRNINEERFTSETVTYIETYFTDDTCSTELFSFLSQGPYVLGANNNRNNIDFAFAVAAVRTPSQIVVDSFNRRSVCGWQNWSVGETKSILNQMCDFFNLGRNFPAPRYAEKKFGIFKIENSQLYFGRLTRDNDGSNEQKRPILWNPRPYQRISPDAR